MMAEETKPAAVADDSVISEEALRKAEEYVQQEEGAGNQAAHSGSGAWGSDSRQPLAEPTR